MDTLLRRRQRERSLAYMRLRSYTRGLIWGSGGLLALLAVVAWQVNPGRANPLTPPPTQYADSQDQQQAPQNGYYGRQGGSAYFGPGAGGAVAVSGGS